MRNSFAFWVVIFLVTMTSCSGNQKPPDSDKIKTLTENQLIRLNKDWVSNESAEIDHFIKQKHWKMKETSTGLRYMIYHRGDGEKAKVGKLATIAYTVQLMNGTVLYSSKKSGLETFEIGHSNVASGLEEGIILLNVGDKAKFLLPSHLAFGLSGDGRKVPPDVPIIYNVELVQLK